MRQTASRPRRSAVKFTTPKAEQLLLAPIAALHDAHLEKSLNSSLKDGVTIRAGLVSAVHSFLMRMSKTTELDAETRLETFDAIMTLEDAAPFLRVQRPVHIDQQFKAWELMKGGAE